jgi:hypothetical protein
MIDNAGGNDVYQANRAIGDVNKNPGISTRVDDLFSGGALHRARLREQRTFPISGTIPRVVIRRNLCRSMNIAAKSATTSLSTFSAR